MTDDTQRRGLVSDLTRRLALAGHDELRVIDRVLQRLEQRRFKWERHVATSPYDTDKAFHLAAPFGRVVVTRCNGRWPAGDAVEHNGCPPVAERCLACQRAAWRETELDPLIVEVLEQLAADDLAMSNLRDAARAEMVGDG